MAYSTDVDSFVYFLDCPFEEKDDVKALGTQFDGSSKRWFVPARHYRTSYSLNRWRPENRLYLDYLFEEKDEVKTAGAKWDPTVRSWYVAKVTKKVKQWLLVEEADALSSSKTGKNKKGTSAGAAKASTTKPSTVIRVSDAAKVSSSLMVAGTITSRTRQMLRWSLTLPLLRLRKQTFE